MKPLAKEAWQLERDSEVALKFVKLALAKAMLMQHNLAHQQPDWHEIEALLKDLRAARVRLES
jgi:predicted membrane chloride channel (bestrophin family)